MISRSLAGTWQFALDPEQRGVPERWFTRNLTDERVRLPGTTDTNRRGTRQTDDPELWGGLTRAWTYEGHAWYQRDITMPAAWAGRRITLFLERCHWRTTVWVNERLVGTDMTLGAPHVYDLGPHLQPGKNRLTILVDNTKQVEMGFLNSHSTTDWTQTNWNGIVGRMELRVQDPVWMERVRVKPDFARRVVGVSGVIRNETGAPLDNVRLSARVLDKAGQPVAEPDPVTIAGVEKEQTFALEWPIGTLSRGMNGSRRCIP